MKTFSVVVISIFLIISGTSGCTFSQFSPNPESRPIFVQKVGGQSLVVPLHSSELKIEENSSVLAYCPGGFRKEGIRDENNEISGSTKVELSCIAGRTVKRDGDRNYHVFEQEEWLNCTRPPFAVYENRQMHRFCEGTSFVVGMLYDSEPITLAEICYDMNRMKVKYQNYKSVERSPIIARKSDHEPLVYYPFDEDLVDAPSQQFYQHFLLAQNLTRKRFIHKSAEYIYEDLIPGDAFEPYYSNPLYAAKALNKIFWWKGLKGGNWRLFEKILKRRSVQVSYDIIMGTMGTSPDCDIRQGPLSEISLTCSVTPKLVWAFLSNNTEEFVVIGVNTPYFQLLSREGTIICRDMCHLINWLEPLNKFRTISALGYIYCCNAHDVRTKMEGVEDLFFKKHYQHDLERRTPGPTEHTHDNGNNWQNSKENDETSNKLEGWSSNGDDSKSSGETENTETITTKKFSFFGR